MKKRLLTLALALSLCLSMAVPALAADRAEKDEVKENYTLERKGADDAQFVEKEITTGISGSTDPEDEEMIHGYTVIPLDTAWTITNTAKSDKITLMVSITLHRKDAKDSYNSIIMDYAAVRQDGSLVYGSDSYMGEDEGELCNIHAGKSVTFTFADALKCLENPDMESSDDVLYSLYIYQDDADDPDGYKEAELWYKPDSATSGNTGDNDQKDDDKKDDNTENTPPASGNVFTDVKATDWFHDAVQWAVEQKITAGTSATTFSPNENCTEGQILTFLWRANKSPEPTNPVTDTAYYAKAVAWAAEKNIISADTFQADTPCTRSTAVQYMWASVNNPEAKPAAFTDVPADAAYAQAVAWAVSQNVTAGTTATTFSPDMVCSRGQIATFLFRAFAD